MFVIKFSILRKGGAFFLFKGVCSSCASEDYSFPVPWQVAQTAGFSNRFSIPESQDVLWKEYKVI